VHSSSATSCDPGVVVGVVGVGVVGVGSAVAIPAAWPSRPKLMATPSARDPGPLATLVGLPVLLSVFMTRMRMWIKVVELWSSVMTFNQFSIFHKKKVRI
jgi:hypothetical protein